MKKREPQSGHWFLTFLASFALLISSGAFRKACSGEKPLYPVTIREVRRFTPSPLQVFRGYDIGLEVYFGYTREKPPYWGTPRNFGIDYKATDLNVPLPKGYDPRKILTYVYDSDRFDAKKQMYVSRYVSNLGAISETFHEINLWVSIEERDANRDHLITHPSSLTLRSADARVLALPISKVSPLRLTTRKFYRFKDSYIIYFQLKLVDPKINGARALPLFPERTRMWDSRGEIHEMDWTMVTPTVPYDAKKKIYTYVMKTPAFSDFRRFETHVTLGEMWPLLIDIPVSNDH